MCFSVCILRVECGVFLYVSYMWSVVLLDCDRMSEKIMLKIFQARISSLLGLYKLINEVRSAWSGH